MHKFALRYVCASSLLVSSTVLGACAHHHARARRAGCSRNAPIMPDSALAHQLGVPFPPAARAMAAGPSSRHTSHNGHADPDAHCHSVHLRQRGRQLGMLSVSMAWIPCHACAIQSRMRVPSSPFHLTMHAVSAWMHHAPPYPAVKGPHVILSWNPNTSAAGII